MAIQTLSFSSEFAKKFGYFESYKEALKVAKESKRDIIMVLVADHYCPWCEELKDEVLSLEYTNNLIRQNFIPLMVYSGSGEFPNKFETYFTPSVLFINYKDESIIETIIGFNNNWRVYEILEANK
jgi:thioredoxin-related protein